MVLRGRIQEDGKEKETGKERGRKGIGWTNEENQRAAESERKGASARERREGTHVDSAALYVVIPGRLGAERENNRAGKGTRGEMFVLRCFSTHKRENKEGGRGNSEAILLGLFQLHVIYSQFPYSN